MTRRILLVAVWSALATACSQAAPDAKLAVPDRQDISPIREGAKPSNGLAPYTINDEISKDEAILRAKGLAGTASDLEEDPQEIGASKAKTDFLGTRYNGIDDNEKFFVIKLKSKDRDALGSGGLLPQDAKPKRMHILVQKRGGRILAFRAK